MFFEKMQDVLWMLLFFPLFTLCGLRLMLHCRLMPFRRFAYLFKAALRGGNGEKVDMTPAQAAGSALAATVGTGNIIGTAQAIAMGGPGAVFWLWVGACMGSMIKYTEIMLGLRFGEGAMGYIRAALGRRAAGFYAALAALSALFVGNMTQMNGAVRSLCTLLNIEADATKLTLGLLLTVCAGVCILGGAGSVGRAAELFTPIMTISYLIVTLGVIFAFRSRLSTVFQLILHDAFRPNAMVGAAGGFALRRSILWGLRRGAFSNEAGLGTAANIHAFSDTSDPAVHAFWGVFEVFADTFVICSATALAILCSGAAVPYGTMPGPELLEQAIAAVFGDAASGIYIAASLVLFGVSTVIGCSLCARSCVKWLFQGHGERVFMIVYLLCSLLGSVLPLDLVWKAADSVNVLLSVPNLLALLLSAPEAGAFVTKRLSSKS